MLLTAFVTSAHFSRNTICASPPNQLPSDTLQSHSWEQDNLYQEKLTRWLLTPYIPVAIHLMNRNPEDSLVRIDCCFRNDGQGMGTDLVGKAQPDRDTLGIQELHFLRDIDGLNGRRKSG